MRKRAPAETGAGHPPLLGIIPACFDSRARLYEMGGCAASLPTLVSSLARHTRGGKAERTHDEMHNSRAGMQVKPLCTRDMSTEILPPS